jgi:hypothetical protein
MTFSLDHSDSPARGRAALSAGLIIAASLVIGGAGGLVWAAVAPRVLYQVVTLNPPTAYATDPETSAFIAADGWYCLIAVVGGALIGLLGYLFGVRRYGPVPMAGIVVGATAAAFICEWTGHRQSGGPGFNHVLATSKPGTLLHAPISLGSQGALAFWPLAAAAVAGGIELVGALRARHQAGFDAVPMPGADAIDQRPALGEAGPRPDQANPELPGQPGGPPDERGSAFDLRPGRPAEDPRGHASGPDARGGDPGRAAL